jgi:hypothetical protein
MKLTASALGAVIFAPFIRQAQGHAATAAVTKAAPAGSWQMIAWQEQRFEDELGRRPGWDNMIGFCGIFQNQETLELTRNAVRLDSGPGNHRLAGNHTFAKNRLRIWRDRLNANWPPDLCRRPTQWFDVFDQHGKLVGWHYDDPWRDSDYGGYEALGYGTVARSR